MTRDHFSHKASPSGRIAEWMDRLREKAEEAGT